jgi:carboxypeptidase family protein
MHVAPRAAVRAPQAFFGLRVEGDDHGPLQLRRQDMSAQSHGSFRVVVARKALLSVDLLPPELAVPDPGFARNHQTLSVSLYSPADPSFREPAFRAKLQDADWRVKIPAGEFVASLTQAAHAPDLHRLTAPPASKVRIAYRRLEGWSLVVRCRAAGGGRLVKGAAVRVAETIGFDRPDRPVAESISQADGLALLSGIGATMASLWALHPGFLPAEIHGISAGPGTFTLREVALEIGGRLVAHVAVHGHPLAGAECEIDAMEVAAVKPHRTAREIWKGTADARGVCRSSRLAAGGYKLGVRIPETTSVVRRWITISEGEDLAEDLALTPARVFGVVTRRGQPAARYVVGALGIPEGKPRGAGVEQASEATSDDTGKYELTLWSAGRYILVLRSPSGGQAGGHKEVTTPGDDDQTVDFELGASAFTGTVVDETGQPVAAASVGLTKDGFVTATTDDRGRFEVEATGEGEMTLQAIKAGYAPSEKLHFQVVKDALIPPVTLVLKRTTSAKGTVVSAAGDPIAGAVVTSFAVTPDGVEDYRSATSGPDGRFEVEIPPGSPPRVFADGPACPLSAFGMLSDGDANATGDDAAGRNVLHCPSEPAVLELTLLDERGKPVPHSVVILRMGGLVVPQRVLATHLTMLGLPPESDGAGRLVLAGLAPGAFDLFLMGRAFEGSIAEGSQRGFLTSVTLPAVQTTEIEVTIPLEQ